MGCSPWGRYELDTTERLHFHFSLSCIGEGSGNALQCSCLENHVDSGAWWVQSLGSQRVGHDWAYIATILQHPFWCKQFSKLPKLCHLFELTLHIFQLRTLRMSSQEYTGFALTPSNTTSSLTRHPPLFPFLPKCQDNCGIYTLWLKKKRKERACWMDIITCLRPISAYGRNKYSNLKFPSLPSTTRVI